jgi:hypothetical protein
MTVFFTPGHRYAVRIGASAAHHVATVMEENVCDAWRAMARVVRWVDELLLHHGDPGTCKFDGDIK